MNLNGRRDADGAVEYIQSKGAAYTKGTLAVYRSIGRGPKFWRVGGRVYYLEADLDDWLASITRKCQRASEYRGLEAA